MWVQEGKLGRAKKRWESLVQHRLIKKPKPAQATNTKQKNVKSKSRNENTEKQAKRSTIKEIKRTASTAFVFNEQQEFHEDGSTDNAGVSMCELNNDEPSDNDIPADLPASTAHSTASHLDEKVLQKIVKGRYVALCTLLSSYLSNTKLSFNENSQALVASNTSRRLFNFSEWTDALLINA